MADELAAEPPHSEEAERGVLGCIFIKNALLDTVREIITPEFFYFPQHKQIYEACLSQADKGRVSDPVTLNRYFLGRGLIESIGGPEYLSDLIGAAPTTGNAGGYAQVVRDLYLRRRLLSLGSDAMAMATVDGGDAEDALRDIEAQLGDIEDRGRFLGGRSQDDMFNESMAEIKRVSSLDGSLPGLSSGFGGLDEILGGFRGGSLYVVAGGTSMGKTVLASNIALNISKTNADSGGDVCMFSLEMSHRQLFERMIANYGSIPLDVVSKGRYDLEYTFAKVESAAAELRGLPLYIDERADLTISDIRAKVRKIKRTKGVRAVVIDYLQLLRSGKRYAGQRVNEVGEVTRGAKILALDLDVPVVLVSQINRELWKRDNKRPVLGDLRESGSIEQDADAVVFCYRDEYYLERDEPHRKSSENLTTFNGRYADWSEAISQARGKAELIIPKNRQGEIGTVYVKFNGRLQRFF